jgi:hypothetical protein
MSFHCIDAENLAVIRAFRSGPYSYDARRKLRSTTTTRIPKKPQHAKGSICGTRGYRCAKIAMKYLQKALIVRDTLTSGV